MREEPSFRDEIPHRLANPTWSALDKYIQAIINIRSRLYIHVYLYVTIIKKEDKVMNLEGWTWEELEVGKRGRNDRDVVFMYEALKKNFNE